MATVNALPRFVLTVVHPLDLGDGERQFEQNELMELTASIDIRQPATIRRWAEALGNKLVGSGCKSLGIALQ